jgi:hypothetical protein
MPQPVSPKITSTPAAPGMPYDARDGDANTSPWRKLDGNAGPADIHSGRVTGEFEDSHEVWRQT